MKRLLITLAAAFCVASTGLSAENTSYLLIQGPFGSSGAEETFEWQVEYPAGTLQTGQDLLNAVFGTPTLSGTYTNAFSETFNEYSAGNSSTGVSYIDYGTSPNTLTEPFAISFSLDSEMVEQDTAYNNGWNYYVAGGGGGNGGDNLGGPYANNGSWIYANDGSYSRNLANGSFDAWAFGSFNNPPGIAGSNYAPTVPDFSGAIILLIPEPGGALLLILGASGLLILKRWRHASCRAKL